MLNSSFFRFSSRSPLLKPNEPSRTRTPHLLDHIQRDPLAGWAKLLPRVELKLRLLLDFLLQSEGHKGLDPQDILQEVWIEATQSLERFEYRGPGSLQRWMAGICRNKVRQAKRGQKRRKEISMEVAFVGGPPGLAEALVASQSSVAEQMRQEERKEQIQQALQKLPEQESQVLHLRLFAGLTGKEIAEKLNWPQSTVTVRFQRALGRCAIHLADLLKEEQ